MAPFRSVILGCGPRAHGHAKAYKYITRGELTACCDLDHERISRFSQEYGLKGYSDFEDMLEQEKPDLVHIVTPPHQRVLLMSKVDQYHIPACIVEKPIACEVRDWRLLCQLEARTKTKFAVGQQVRFQEYLKKCKQALDSGRLGKLRFIDFSAGMNIAAQGTHMIDWAMFLNNDIPVTSVFGAVSGIDPDNTEHPAPEIAIAQVVFANGVYGFWNAGSTARRVLPDKETWKHLRIAAYADEGHVLFEEFGKWEIVSANKSGGSEQSYESESGCTTLEKWADMNDQALAQLINSMYEWIENPEKPSSTSLTQALHQWNIILGLYASALWRKPVDIPFNPPDELFDLLIKELEDINN